MRRETMPPGFVRIIAGKWRGRRLKVPDIEGLRPTPDRVKETVFNWLTTTTNIEGARCLDLFAGSGALGFEALSRGAAFVEMVDESSQVVSLLKSALQTFQADNANVYQGKLPHALQLSRPFDIVFIDPPYQANLLLPCCFYLEEKNFLANTAYLYLEAQQDIKDNDLPPNWRLLKSKIAGQVHYHLAIREQPA
jgi:16S rRNA (guanine966-N2)-methyltransferase